MMQTRAWLSLTSPTHPHYLQFTNDRSELLQNNYLYLKRSRYNDGLRAGMSGFESRQGKEIFFSPHRVQERLWRLT
jgi:hypothetical protein